MTYSQIQDLINLNLASGTKIPAVKHREVELALLDYIQANLSQSGDIKTIKADNTYLNDNFDVNGLGKNLRLGWALCNGNNGTPNITGRTIIGHGLGYSTLGALGGSKDAVVVSHTHTFTGSEDDIGDNGPYIIVSNSHSIGTKSILSTTGEVGTDKNMQPYIVQLYIMKL
jgi:hypothetical protein